ncbi:hypothetical protein D3C72_1748500 [compost metagenome]
MFAQHLIAIEVHGVGGLHGGADEAFRAAQVQARAHIRVAEAITQGIDQCLVGGKHFQTGRLCLLQGLQVVMARERLRGIQQGAVLALARGHVRKQAQHGGSATALARDQVTQATCHGLKLVVDRAALDAGNKHGDTPLKPYCLWFYMFCCQGINA